MRHKDIVQMVRDLKEYKDKIYSLTPAKFSHYLKLKSNMAREGIIITDEKLSMPEATVVDFIKTGLGGSCNKGTKKISIPIQEAFEESIEDFDNDRIAIRKHLFDNEIGVKISHSGRAFTVQWNSKMTACKINVPSNWNITLEQSLLLDLYEKDYSSKTKVKDHASKMTRLGVFVYDLLSRHSDYSVIKRIVELEFESSEEMFVNDLDKRRLSRLNSKGYSLPVSALLLAFAEQIVYKCFSDYSINQIFGFRKRLSNEMLLLVSSISKP